MKRTLITILLASAVTVTGPVLASRSYHSGPSHGYSDYGDVIDVRPIYRQVEISTPRRECWQEEVRRPVRGRGHHGSTAGPIIVGGVLGGLAGNHIVRGRDRDVATLAGTLIGSALGHDYGHKRSYHAPAHTRVSYEEHCRTVEEYRTEERLQHYRVTYAYQGKTFETELPYDPGDRVRVDVNVSVR